MSAPCSRIVPLVGCSKPAIRRRSVVFPQPEGPSSVKNSLSRISTETSSSALTGAPVPASNTFVTATASIAAAPRAFAVAVSGISDPSATRRSPAAD